MMMVLARIVALVLSAVLLGGQVAGAQTWLARARQQDTPPPSPDCLIKGNVSDRGERIYHLPGCRFYNATKIDPARGERWFCSEAEAVAAGWRRSKVC
ncbi:MAG: succinoglycan biosynthesis protein exoi [Reyranellaceae bacterium]